MNILIGQAVNLYEFLKPAKKNEHKKRSEKVNRNENEREDTLDY